MIVRVSKIITLPSGNTARNFKIEDCGYGRVLVQYNYTDRRRNNKVSRHFEAEFLNGKLESITARSARGGRVESFSTSIILDELLGMLIEFNEVEKCVAQHRYAKVEAPAVEDSVSVEASKLAEDDTSGLMDTLKTVGGMVMVNILITLVTLGIVWYNL